MVISTHLPLFALIGKLSDKLPPLIKGFDFSYQGPPKRLRIRIASLGLFFAASVAFLIHISVHDSISLPMKLPNISLIVPMPCSTQRKSGEDLNAVFNRHWLLRI